MRTLILAFALFCLPYAALAEEQSKAGSSESFSPSPVSLDWRTKDEANFSSFGSAAKGLGFCIAVLLIGLGIAKKFGRTLPPAKRRCKILERTNLTGKTALFVIEYEGKKLLCAAGPDRVSVLSGDKENFTDSLELACVEELKISA